MKVDRHSNQGSENVRRFYHFPVKLSSLKSFALALIFEQQLRGIQES